MSIITYETVAAAALALEGRGQEPSVRTIREQMGGGSLTTINPLLRQWKEARAARRVSTVQVNQAIVDLILAQIEETAAQAAREASLRAKEAEESFDHLAGEMRQAQAQLTHREEELAAARAQLLQHQGQLQERAREIDELRSMSAAAISEAEQRAADERARSESLRQDLIRSSLRLERVPDLETALEEARRLVHAGQEEVARLRQSEAVAVSRAENQLERARDWMSREGKLEAQVHRLQDERERAAELERASQQEILRLSTMVSALEARSFAQQAEITKLREAKAESADLDRRCQGPVNNVPRESESISR
jgi:hypothetical protein